jgi:voltage-gated potassium channel
VFLKIEQNFIVVDNGNEIFSHANTQNFLSIKGDATDSSFLSSLGINNGATAIIAITNSDAVNLSIILTARSQNPNIHIIARANDEEVKKKLFLAGADEVVFASETSALVAAEYIEEPIAFEAVDNILLNDEGSVMDEVEIVQNSNYIGLTLENINFAQFNLIFIGVVETSNNKKFIFNPPADKFLLKDEDILIVIGHKESISKFKIELISSREKFLSRKEV